MDRKKPNTIALYILAAVIVSGFFVLLYFLVFNKIPEGNESLLKIAVGALISSFTGVVGYFFGSSAGSANKTDLIAKTSEQTAKDALK
jgi:drug/metabolite transporter (DMT)-like permease